MKKIKFREMINLIVVALVLPAIIGVLFSAVEAQKKISRPAYLQGSDLKTAVENARQGRSRADASILNEIKSAASEKPENFFTPGQNLVGTWNVTVPGETPADTFYALQTFHEGGTFTETSSLLGKLPEGPAHGAFACLSRYCLLTFELFEFAPDGSSVGKLRVRNVIYLTDATHLLSRYSIDFIEPNGSVVADIATGSYTGEKMQVSGL